MMSDFRKWDELSELEQLQNIYSDNYKDAYGFRPRPSKDQWNCPQWLKDELDDLRETEDPQSNMGEE